MKQEAFEARHEAEWQAFADWLERLSRLRRSAERPEDDESFPALYRKICHHLALARTRRYSSGLQQRLNTLALDGHQYLYRPDPRPFGSLVAFFARDFPRSLREHGAYFFVACLLFFGTGAAVAIAITLNPAIVYSIIDQQQVVMMESMYDPDNDVLGRERQSDTDIMMFGYYVYNNVSIGFQTVAGGIVFGLGTIFYLVFNGLVIGAIATHLTLEGMTETFWTFVAGHGAFELTAIVIYGAVGLALGRQLIAPGRKTRWQATADQARASLSLIYGATVMMFSAAFVEAFWSSTTWPPPLVKYSVGIALWLVVIAYFTLFGRNGSPARNG